MVTNKKNCRVCRGRRKSAHRNILLLLLLHIYYRCDGNNTYLYTHTIWARLGIPLVYYNNIPTLIVKYISTIGISI